MAKRLLVTGAAGFVAGSVIWQAGPEWEPFGVSIEASYKVKPGVPCQSLDMRDETALRAYFQEVKPHAVIHTAALADIDFCQTHQEDAEAINVGVTRALAHLCREAGAKMVVCSTDTVFGGATGMYREEDAPEPLNFYAETKVRAEQAVLNEAGAGVVTRLSLVMGLPVMGSGNSFLVRMVDKLKQGQEVAMPAEEIRTPLDVITAGRALLELAGNDYTGLMHLSGNDRLSRFAMAQFIAGEMGLPMELVAPTPPSNIPGRARRPADVSLDNSRAKSVLETPMRSLREGLELVLNADKELSQ